MSVSGQDGVLVPVWFIAPPGFTQISLTEEPEIRAEKFAQVLDALYPDVDPIEKLTLVGANEMFVQQLLRDGAIYMASFLYSLEDGSACSGMAAAFMVEGRVPGGAQFVERLISEISERYTEEPIDAGVVTLPAGRAAVIARDITGPSVTSILLPNEDGERELQRQLETYIPFPDGSAYLKVVIGTSDLHAWKEILPILGGFISGISFSPPVDTGHRKYRASRAEVEMQMRREFG